MFYLYSSDELNGKGTTIRYSKLVKRIGKGGGQIFLQIDDFISSIAKHAQFYLCTPLFSAFCHFVLQNIHFHPILSYHDSMFIKIIVFR